MARVSYIDGRYVQHRDARVHMEDRSCQFADGVYEVIAFYNRRLLDEALHRKRLARSLKELAIRAPMHPRAFSLVIAELIARNDREDGTIYLQVSRGVAKRDHVFPKEGRPTLMMMVTGPKSPKEKELREGVNVISLPDQRWARRDVKSVSLLPNVLAKEAASAAGAREAWLVDEEGIVSEGAVSNNAIVTREGEIVTHPLGETILGGVTRDVVLKLARAARLRVNERPFSLREAKKAAEAFLMSTTSNVLPVTRIDGEKVGGGTPGPVTRKLLGLYYEHIRAQTGKSWR